MPQPRRPQQPPSPADQRAAQAAAAAAAAATAAGVAAPRPSAPSPTLPMVAAADIARATATVAALLGNFFDERLRRDEKFLRARLPTRTGVKATDVETAVAEEVARAATFRRLAEQRVRRDLPIALAIPEPGQRERAVRGLMGREAHYQRQRTEAMSARAVAAVDRGVLRRESPQGAFWRLDPLVAEHTAGCLVMGGRFWPWEVLDRVHPPRHAACPCRLVSYGAAIASGELAPGAVMNVQDAVRAAAGIVMESEGVEPGELSEAETGALRAALLAQGMIDPVEFDAIMASDNWRKQPRDPGGEDGGRWVKGAGAVPKLADVAERMTTLALAWNARTGADISKAPPRAQIVANWTKQFRGRLSKDREAWGRVAEAEAENAANPLWAKILAKHEPDYVVVTTAKPQDSRHRLIDTEGGAHRVAGATVFPDVNVREVVRDAKDPQSERAAAASGYGLAALLRHEYGHSIDFALPKDVRRKIIDAIPDPGADLSYYAGWHKEKGNAGEVIPELLALVTHPRYRESDWPETVRNAGRLLIAAVTGD